MAKREKEQSGTNYKDNSEEDGGRDYESSNYTSAPA